MKPTVVIGMGNALMSDEGVGCHVAHALLVQGVPDRVEVADLGTSWMSVLHEIRGRSRVLFVDCALMGEPAGTIRRFTPEEVLSQKVVSRTSLHEGDLLNTLVLARRLDTFPMEVVIFGIQPASLVVGEHLSPHLARMLPTYVSALELELKTPLRAEEGVHA